MLHWFAFCIKSYSNFLLSIENITFANTKSEINKKIKQNVLSNITLDFAIEYNSGMFVKTSNIFLLFYFLLIIGKVHCTIEV